MPPAGVDDCPQGWGVGDQWNGKLDRPALRPLPAQPYCFRDWKTLKVKIDYHVELERHYYSIPYQLVGQEVDAARYTGPPRPWRSFTAASVSGPHDRSATN